MSEAYDRSSDHPLLLLLLAQSQGYLIKSGSEWCQYSMKNSYSRPVGRTSEAEVRWLFDRGHLVARAGGGLEPLSCRMAAGGRMTDHRPLRPASENSAAIKLPAINDAESPLTWLRSRKDKTGRPLISAEQFMAGEKLRADYERSCMERRVTACWDTAASAGRTGGNSAADFSDAAMTARQNVNDALEQVGPELASILIQVCCLAAGIEQAERILDLPQRSGKAVLGLALTGLARHYGFTKPQKFKRHASGFGHWAMDDYRPAIPSASDR